MSVRKRRIWNKVGVIHHSTCNMIHGLVVVTFLHLSHETCEDRFHIYIIHTC